MKRDMDLVKAILLDLEKNCDGTIAYQPSKETVPYAYPGTDAEFEEHCRLIEERGLANTLNSVNAGIFFLSLTWAGHDFLDDSRESKVWQAAKKAAGNLSFGVFTKVLVETATRYAMSKIEGV